MFLYKMNFTNLFVEGPIFLLFTSVQALYCCLIKPAIIARVFVSLCRHCCGGGAEEGVSLGSIKTNRSPFYNKHTFSLDP